MSDFFWTLNICKFIQILYSDKKLNITLMKAKNGLILLLRDTVKPKN